MMLSVSTASCCVLTVLVERHSPICIAACGIITCVMMHCTWSRQSCMSIALSPSASLLHQHVPPTCLTRPPPLLRLS
jgi:hypothetical protein